MTAKMSAPDARRRGAWFAGGALANGKISQTQQAMGDFEHLFIKRRTSHTTQKIMKNDRSSMLSVVR